VIGDRCHADDFFLVAPQAIARGDGDPMLGLAAGARFGVLGLRRAGAHGAVYDAWDAAQKEACVLKVARCERHALGHVHDLFLREARLMRSASMAPSEREVGVNELDPIFAYLAMDDVRGRPITEHRAPLVERVKAALSALAELHGSGVFHGDLKPAHLLFDEGRVTLLDFGSAAFADKTREATRQMTPAYAAPERELTGPSAASDVYSLGCVLFEMAVGARPFASLSGAALADAHANQPVSCDRLPPELGPAISAALRERAVERPSAAELLAVVA
jgi:serine/threonine-protein kinase